MKSDWKIKLPEYQYELNAGNASLTLSPCIWSIGRVDLVLTDEEYEGLLNLAIGEIKRGEIAKIVLSRIIASQHKTIDPTVVSLFHKKFPASCAFYIPINDDQVWFGASPELLMQGGNGKWKTRSIAGTRLKNDKNPWGEKELFEQKVVTNGIVNALLELKAFNIQIHEPYTFQSGSIEHICSEIEFEFEGDIQQVIDHIHPSAAVLGMPKDKSQSWLSKNEPHRREWYTGTMKIIHNEMTYVYVFLRCGKASNNGVHWYVGGGLTADSIAQNELQETIHKANSLEEVISSQL
jgi:isochorismate synthase